MVRLAYAGVAGLLAGALTLALPGLFFSAVLGPLPSIPYPWAAEILTRALPVLVLPLGLTAVCFALADRHGTEDALRATVLVGVATALGLLAAFVLLGGDLALTRGGLGFYFTTSATYGVRGGIAALAGFGAAALRDR